MVKPESEEEGKNPVTQEGHRTCGKRAAGKETDRAGWIREVGHMAKLFYLMGKSATGKDHIYRSLLEEKSLHLKPLIIYTTRPMRGNEKDGREYFFRDEAFLQDLRKKGKIIEERVYATVQGPWYYFTADDGQLRKEEKGDFIGIGTLASYRKIRDYYGQESVVPIYIETEDGLRLERALAREKKQEHPDYREMCRRFLGDTEDFSEEKLKACGICRRFVNNHAPIKTVMDEIGKYIQTAGA